MNAEYSRQGYLGAYSSAPAKALFSLEMYFFADDKEKDLNYVVYFYPYENIRGSSGAAESRRVVSQMS